MTTGECLFQQILTAPEDDTVRLVYADWLEENGDSDRAEFIKVQLELQQFPFAEEVRSRKYDAQDGIDADWKRAFELHDREMRLLWKGDDDEKRWTENWVNWCWTDARDDEGMPVPQERWGGMTLTPHGSPGLGGNPQSCGVPTNRGLVRQVFRRGFVSEVAMRTGTFYEPKLIGRLFRSQPVETLVLNDRRPEVNGGYGLWSRLDLGTALSDTDTWEPSAIPDSIFDYLRNGSWATSRCDSLVFSSNKKALEELSKACVRFGRDVVGLPWN